MKRGPAAAVVLGFLMLVGAAWAVRARRIVVTPGTPAVVTVSASAPQAPAGVRVRVEVINTTRTRGLARRATRILRNQGFDVVEIGTSGPTRDSTLVLDRSRHPSWASAIATLLGPASRWESQPDSSHYVDVTVLLGSTWRPPAQPLDP